MKNKIGFLGIIVIAALSCFAGDNISGKKSSALAINSINNDEIKAGEGPKILVTIAKFEAAFHAETDSYVNAAQSANKSPQQGDGWYEMGFAENPFSEYYTFEVKTNPNRRKFVATATLKMNLGNAKAGDYISIDEEDNKVVSSPVLQALIPDFK
jgi:hypothetical protein